MAEYAQALHHEIDFDAQQVLTMPDIVRAMNEPFCDVGINIATYLLGKEASVGERYILTGDGGEMSYLVGILFTRPIKLLNMRNGFHHRS